MAHPIRAASLTDAQLEMRASPVPAVGMSFASASVGMLHVSSWWGAANPRDVERLDLELEEIAEQQGRVAVLLVVRSSAPLAGDETRKRAISMLQKLGDRVDSVAIVVEGKGFWAGAVRSMFSGLAFAFRPGFPWKIFATAGPALLWQGPRVFLKHGPETSQVRQLIESLRVD